jgi:DNA invertase Pin-like site-specific DNA recombinase
MSATDDRRPEFQRMIDVATVKPPAFDVILVHSFSRFFRDQFQLEFYVRRLAKNGVRRVSITQELGDDPMSNMIRQIMALFDEYQSKENAKHTLRAMKENARQGFWNGALPPIGYRIVEAAEQRGHRTKKTLEIDSIQAETVRLIFRLARTGNGSSGSMGVKSIAKYLNDSGIRTRDGGRWGVDAVHKVLTRTTYVDRHRFNTKHPASESPRLKWLKWRHPASLTPPSSRLCRRSSRRAALQWQRRALSAVRPSLPAFAFAPPAAER